MSWPPWPTIWSAQPTRKDLLREVEQLKAHVLELEAARDTVPVAMETVASESEGQDQAGPKQQAAIITALNTLVTHIGDDAGWEFLPHLLAANPTFNHGNVTIVSCWLEALSDKWKRQAKEAAEVREESDEADAAQV